MEEHCKKEQRDPNGERDGPAGERQGSSEWDCRGPSVEHGGLSGEQYGPERGFRGAKSAGGAKPTARRTSSGAALALNCITFARYRASRPSTFE